MSIFEWLFIIGLGLALTALIGWFAVGFREARRQGEEYEAQLKSVAKQLGGPLTDEDLFRWSGETPRPSENRTAEG